MSNLNPLAVSVTWGAGGNTKDTSLNLAELTQSEYRQDTILHLTCTNMEKGMVDEALRVSLDLVLDILANLTLSGCQRMRDTEHTCITWGYVVYAAYAVPTLILARSTKREGRMDSH